MNKELKQKTNTFIHDACLSIITTLNIPIRDVSHVLNINYHTATKKNRKSHGLCFTESDLDLLIEKMDSLLEIAMIKRKDVKELKNNIKFMQNNLHN